MVKRLEIITRQMSFAKKKNTGTTDSDEGEDQDISSIEKRMNRSPCI